MVPMSLAPSMESKPIREVAYETLKNAIVTGEIPAGSRIVETEYAERMHMSRTPLREALRKLEKETQMQGLRAFVWDITDTL